MSNQVKVRESNFELLRLVAMFCIVLYHLLLYFVIPTKGEGSIFYALQLPLHIGVLLFVFISGYFGIKPNIRSLGKLLLMTAIYFLPLQVFHDFTAGEGFKQIIKDTLVISQGPYWFIRTYILFYLFVPIINIFLDRIDSHKLVYSLGIMAIINFYFGAIVQGDPSLIDGKNIVNFTFLYLLGYTVRRKITLRRIKMIHFAIALVVLNILLVSTCYCTCPLIRHCIMRIAFGYNSPLLLCNALLLFLVFSKLKFKSNFINQISASTFAVYLITEHPIVRNGILRVCAEFIIANSNYSVTLFGGLILLTITIMIITICIDKVLSPFWNLSKKIPLIYF